MGTRDGYVVSLPIRGGNEEYNQELRLITPGMLHARGGKVNAHKVLTGKSY
jgi:hypothetical protein